jgi:hypothetical protein
MEISSSSFRLRRASVIVSSTAHNNRPSIMFDANAFTEKLAAWAELSAALSFIAFIVLN